MYWAKKNRFEFILNTCFVSFRFVSFRLFLGNTLGMIMEYEQFLSHLVEYLNPLLPPFSKQNLSSYVLVSIYPPTSHRTPLISISSSLFALLSSIFNNCCLWILYIYCFIFDSFDSFFFVCQFQYKFVWICRDCEH
jgi:hypothetical protein